MAAGVTVASLLAVASLAGFRCLLRRRRPRVWTVWAGAGGGHATVVASRKTRREAAAMIARLPGGVAVVGPTWTGVVPPRGTAAETVMWGGRG